MSRPRKQTTVEVLIRVDLPRGVDTAMLLDHIRKGILTESDTSGFDTPQAQITEFIVKLAKKETRYA